MRQVKMLLDTMIPGVGLVPRGKVVSLEDDTARHYVKHRVAVFYELPIIDVDDDGIPTAKEVVKDKAAEVEPFED